MSFVLFPKAAGAALPENVKVDYVYGAEERQLRLKPA
jgi:hypothetical protein